MTHAVYVPRSAEAYELCQPCQKDDYERINVMLDGTPRAGSWAPIAVRIVHEDGGQSLEESDSPWLGSHALVLRPRALEQVRQLLSSRDEVLPLLCDEAVLHILNPMCLETALDEAASTVWRLKSGRIARISRHVFRVPEVQGRHAFKIQSLRVSPTYVSGDFVRLWRNAGLRGLEFDEVWSNQ